jgi:catalase
MGRGFFHCGIGQTPKFRPDNGLSNCTQRKDEKPRDSVREWISFTVENGDTPKFQFIVQICGKGRGH